MRKLFHFLFISMILLCVDSMALGSGRYWSVTHQWQNDGNMQTEPFRIYGKKWRIHGQFSRKSKAEVSSFSASNEKFTRIFYHPCRSNRSQKTHSITLKNNDQGDQFIKVNAPGESWSITVEQYFDHTDDWLSRKDHIRKSTPKQTLGTWSGTGDKTFTFDTDQALWFLTAAPQHDGKFAVTVKDSDNKVIFSSTACTVSSPRSSFFYAPGQYTIEVKADQISWMIYASQPETRALQAP